MEEVIRVNADFEEVLWGKPPNPKLGERIEFLALWVQDSALSTKQNYPEDYLSHVRRLSGRPARTTPSPGVDWWGQLEPREVMRDLCSKAEAAKWWSKRYPLESRVCSTMDEVKAVVKDGEWLVKSSAGMSGRGHLKVTKDAIDKRVVDMLKHEVVVEPLYRRTQDVSALWLPEEHRYIFYTNQIDERFQWRSSLLTEEVKVPDEWKRHLGELQQYVSGKGYHGPFSVDAFYYQDGDKEKLHPGSEINPRKTMGWLAYHLWKIKKTPWCKLQLSPKPLAPSEWKQTSVSDHSWTLSPPNAPFTWTLSWGQSPHSQSRTQS